MLLHYAQWGPLWIIVACRQIKNKRAPEQISTGAAAVVAEKSGDGRGVKGWVSKHVEQMGNKSRGR
jgi:hypothetical protein